MYRKKEEYLISSFYGVVSSSGDSSGSVGVGLSGVGIGVGSGSL